MNTKATDASIGWIDFSPTHRNRIGTVLDLLRPEGMVDELGLGVVRDALANQMFPGISTIQTRAKYFFIIPYILYEYQQLPTAKRKNKTAAQYLEQREYEIMWQLAETYNHEEGNGVIGISKRRPQKIVRRPSAIYWNGLSTFRFIDTRGLATEAFLKQASSPSLSDLLSYSKEGDDGAKDDADAAFENTFRIKIPPVKNWDNELTLGLTPEEGEIFRDKILSVSNNRLLAALLTRAALWKTFDKTKSFMDFAKQSAMQKQLHDLDGIVTLAHDFSELMYGAHLLYNQLLQAKAFGSDGFKENWKTWARQLPSAMINFNSFDPEKLFECALTVSPGTATFIRNWWQHAKSGFTNKKALEQLIVQQEARAKRSKARLQWNKTEDVKRDRWIGLTHFDYRFNQVKTIIKDIKAAIN